VAKHERRFVVADDSRTLPFAVDLTIIYFRGRSARQWRPHVGAELSKEDSSGPQE
jgi:hypothetical protein